MSFGRSFQSNFQLLRAMKFFALSLILVLVGCDLPPTSPNISAITPSIQSSPSPSPSANPPDSEEISPTTAPAATQLATPTPTSTNLPSKTETADPQPFVPIVGNADKIAFIEQNKIWMANVDADKLTQLTDDNLPKSSLQWAADTNGVIYLTGLCVNYVDIYTLQIRSIACFDQAARLESFQISPDGKQAAISLDGQLYVVPYDEARLSQVRSKDDLSAMAECESLAPYKHRGSLVTVSKARWSKNGDRLAILRQAFDAERHVELIQIIDITRCAAPFPRVDEFPATRFEMEDYSRHPVIQDFTWNGADLFALTSYQRNDGYGELWIYNTDLHRGFKSNPIEGKCCYRDPVFSPDGKYLAFVFQDARRAPHGPAVLYYIPYAALDSGLVFPPLPLPAEFFSDRLSKPQPILRPVP